MSELAVTQALACIIANTKIPELEAEISRLKVLYERAKFLVHDLDRGNYDICYTCMEPAEHSTRTFCRVCLGCVCVDCKPNCIQEPRCNFCNSVIHEECLNKPEVELLPDGSCNNCIN